MRCPWAFWKQLCTGAELADPLWDSWDLSTSAFRPARQFYTSISIRVLSIILIFNIMINFEQFLVTLWKNLHEAGGFVSSSLFSFCISDGCWGCFRSAQGHNLKHYLCMKDITPVVDLLELRPLVQKCSTPYHQLG